MWFSFKSNTQRQEVQRVTRRIIDSTVAAHRDDSRRADRRSVRQIPAFVAARVDQSDGLVTNAITRDISDTGMSLLVSELVDATEVVIVLLFEGEPRFFVGKVCQNRPFGAGFWHLGVNLTELIDPLDDRTASRLLPLVPHLSADSAAATC